MVKEVYIVVPLSRPHMLDRVLENFHRQRFVERYLVLVENGAAAGACATKGVVPDILLSCARDVGLARQTGVEAVRERGSYVVFMDDDDYYGPDYVIEVVKHARRGQVTAKSNHFVQSLSNGMRLFEWKKEHAFVTRAHGATLSFWADEAEDFPTGKRWGEDLDWLERMRAAGKTVYSTSCYNYLYIRRGVGHGHSWQVNDKTIVGSCKGPVYSLGEVDLDVVNGRKPCPDGVLLNQDRFGPQRQECRS